MNDVAEHFDTIAVSYDTFKKKNWYYYQNLKSLIRQHIPENKIILEIGTGTGDILASLQPAAGTGIDISAGMIEIARKKHAATAALAFSACRIQDIPEQKSWDFIILIDVVEHVEDMPAMVSAICARMKPGTRVFISMANPLWEPVLMLLEKLKMKMPEGKHYRISADCITDLFRQHQGTLAVHGYALLIPAYVPLIASFMNRIFYRIPFLRRLGLIEYLIYTK